MSLGKTLRMKRLIEPRYGSCIVCALDHGMTSPRFLDGLYDTRAIAGGARGRVWLQIKADITGKPITVPRELETTALGAAMLAGVAGGLFANLSEAAQKAVTVTTTIEPNFANKSAYDDAYALYRQVYDALQEPFRKAAKR